jgi:hypothetical protein
LKNKILLGLIVVLLQCSSPQSFSYTPTDHPEPKVKLEKRIGILPFKDLRPEKDEYKAWIPYFFLPLVLWQTFEDERPRQYDINYKFSFDNDLANALRTELESNKNFSKVFLTKQAKPEDYDLKIEGEILSTKEKTIVISYGLGVFRALIDWLPIPISKRQNNITLNLKLIETKSNKVLFSKTYQGSKERYLSRSSYLSEKFQNEIEIVQRMFPEIANDIVNAISKK